MGKSVEDVLDPGRNVRGGGDWIENPVDFWVGGGLEEKFGVPGVSDLTGKTAMDNAIAQQQNAIAAAEKLRELKLNPIQLGAAPQSSGNLPMLVHGMNAVNISNTIDPLRQGMISQSLNTMGIPTKGNESPTGIQGSPQYSAYKASIEDQFRRAQENVRGSAPAGGSLTDTLANLQTQRALGLAKGAGDIYGQEVDRALGLVGQQSALGQQALGQASQLGLNLNTTNANLQQNRDLAQGNISLNQQGNELTQASNAAQIQAGLAGNMMQAAGDAKSGAGSAAGSVAGSFGSKAAKA